MEHGREVKKSFCLLSVAYIVLGLVLVIWPDISVHTFCFVFGIGMIIFGGAHLILYFTKDRFMNVMQPDLVIGVVCVSTGCYILLKMEYMLEIIPFAMGIVALLGGIIKIQSAIDLKRIGAQRWWIMLIWAVVLLIVGAVLVANPFDEQQKMVVMLTGVSLLIDGIGNLISIFWMGIAFRALKKVSANSEKNSDAVMEVIDMKEDAESEKTSKIVRSSAFFRKKAAKEKKQNEDSLPIYADCEEVPAEDGDVDDTNETEENEPAGDREHTEAAEESAAEQLDEE